MSPARETELAAARETGAAAERAAIVAWLRSEQNESGRSDDRFEWESVALSLADQIDQGAHGIHRAALSIRGALRTLDEAGEDGLVQLARDGFRESVDLVAQSTEFGEPVRIAGEVAPASGATDSGRIDEVAEPDNDRPAAGWAWERRVGGVEDSHPVAPPSIEPEKQATADMRGTLESIVEDATARGDVNRRALAMSALTHLCVLESGRVGDRDAAEARYRALLRELGVSAEGSVSP